MDSLVADGEIISRLTTSDALFAEVQGVTMNPEMLNECILWQCELAIRRLKEALLQRIGFVCVDISPLPEHPAKFQTQFQEFIARKVVDMLRASRYYIVLLHESEDSCTNFHLSISPLCYAAALETSQDNPMCMYINSYGVNSSSSSSTKSDTPNGKPTTTTSQGKEKNEST